MKKITSLFIDSHVVFLWKVKNKRKFETLSSKSVRDRLREVVAYKTFQILWFDLETFDILEKRSLRRDGRLREQVTREGSTVLPFGLRPSVRYLSTHTRSNESPDLHLVTISIFIRPC